MQVEVNVDGTVGAVIAAIARCCFEPARANGKSGAASVAIPVRLALSKKKPS